MASGMTETAAAFVMRLRMQHAGFLRITHAPNLDKLLGLRPGAIRFIQGAKNTGKTEFLLQAISSYILPEQYDGISLGGCDACTQFTLSLFPLHRLVQLIDWKVKSALMDHHGVDATTLYIYLLSFILSTSHVNPFNSTESVLHKCLSHLYIIQPANSFQLRVSLLALQKRLENIPIQKEARVLLAVDGLDEYYWSDRQEKNPLKRVEELIIDFIKGRYNTAAICTCSAQYPSNQGADNVLRIRAPGVLRYRDAIDIHFQIDAKKGFTIPNSEVLDAL